MSSPLAFPCRCSSTPAGGALGWTQYPPFSVFFKDVCALKDAADGVKVQVTSDRYETLETETVLVQFNTSELNPEARFRVVCQGSC